jgi:hypothetical protein
MRGPDTGVVPPSNGPTETAQIQNVRKEEKPTEQRGFFGEVGDSLRGLGDWFGRNKDWLVPAAGFLAGSAQAPSFALGLAPGFKTALGAYTGVSDIGIRQQQADIAAARSVYPVYTDLNARIASAQANAAREGKTGNIPELEPMIRQRDILGRQIAQVMNKYLPSTEGKGAVAAKPSIAPPPIVSVGAPSEQPQTAIPSAPVAPEQADEAIPVWARRAGIRPDEQKWFQENVNPARLPDNLRKAATIISATNPREAERLSAEAIESENRFREGQVPVKGGGYASMPGWARMEAERKRIPVNAAFLAEGYNKNLGNYETLNANFNEMTNALQKFETGKDAEFINNLAGRLERYTGIHVEGNATNLEEYQKFKKGVYQSIATNLKALGAPSDARLEGVASGLPGSDLTPEANKEIIAYLRATTNWMRDRDEYVRSQIQKHGPHIDTASAIADWMKDPKNNISNRAQAEKKEIAALGDYQSAHGRFVPGQRYVLPNRDVGRYRERKQPDGSIERGFE